MKTFQSTPITFIDQTDSRKLEVYITSNLPTVQIFNQNSGAHTPDWREGENLVLSMDVFLDSRKMTVAEYNGTAIKWYKNDVEMSDGSIEDISDDKRKITIKDNILKDDTIITYTCEATYQDIVASSRITFTRVDSGLNGNDGADGTSVNIKATASSVTPITGTDYYTITYNSDNISSAELNDAYMYNGDLYVCVDSRDGVDYFINVGRIQGPAGEPAKNIVLSGSAQVFKISKTNVYTPNTISVTAHTFNTSVTNWTYSTNGGQTFLSTVPTGVSRNGNVVTVTGSTLASNSIVVKASDGTVEDVFTIYKAFDGTDGSDGDKGDPAPLAFLTNENISFAANENGQVPLTTFTTNVVAYNGTTKVAPTVRVKADGIPDITDLPVGMTVSTPIKSSNEQILTFSIANNATLGSSSSNSGTITIPITSPVSTNLKLSWSKINTGNTGVGIKSTTVTYGVSDSSTAKPTEWQSAIPTVADGKYLWTRTIIDYTDEAKPDTVTYIYAKQGIKGDTGNPGNSVTVSSIQYQEGMSATTAPTGTWSNAVVAVDDGRYLWSKTVFSDGKIAYGVAKQGERGATGVGIKSVAEKYLATASSSGVTISTTGWTDAIQTITATNKYLWNYEIITYTNDTTTTTAPVIIGVFGNTGGTGPQGKGIKSITEYYLATSSASGVTTSTTGWTNTIQTISATNKYLWNYELITYTDNTTATIAPVVIGVYGDKGDKGNPGDDAYTVILTNESNVFAGDVSNALAGETSTQVLAYLKNVAQTVTIVSVNGIAASTSATATGITGLTFQCNALAGTSPIITFKCTTAFKTANGTIPIKLKVGNIEFTKVFTYSIAFKGTTGAPSSSYWLVSNASAVQKTSNGDTLFTPATLTFTGKVKTGSGAPTDYAGRWILAYSTDGSTYTNSYTSTANEATASITASDTYKSVRARMYLAGGTTTLLDEQIVPFVSDGEVGPIGPTGDDAVTFQVYSSNGYALSTSVPTITLQTFAYIGDVEITAGATFQWYRHNGTDWVAISGATNSYLNVSRDDVAFSNNYRCIMQFNSTEYVGVVTIDDKNDENRVFASKPSTYFAGDLWIVGTDYIPSNFTLGTMLRAEHTNSSYKDSDWVAATKYDDEIGRLTKTVGEYEQYFSVDSTNGLKVGDASINDNLLKVDRIETTSVNAREVKVESPLTVTGKYSGSTMLQAPILNLGNFSLVIESNGSLSVVANT